ncbi:hypothetical protein [Streptomyces rochei]|nr:hypothetical protein [Streptomyces parvulus]
MSPDLHKEDQRSPRAPEHLEDVVDHGHELTMLLAAAVRSTAASHTSSGS